MIEIQIGTLSPRFALSVELDAETFTFDFEWNDRDSSWSFNVATSAGVILAQGIRISVGIPLLARFRDFRLPAGILEAIDVSDANLDPLYADLGVRVVLAYTPTAELPADFKV